MKKFTQLLTLSFLMILGFQQQADAQVVDSLPYFKADLITFGDDFNTGKTYTVVDMSVFKQTKHENVKTSSVFIVLEAEAKQFNIGMPPAVKKEGAKCKIMWYDRNQDGKIQPDSELRGANMTTKKPMKLKVKAVAKRK